MKTSGKGNIIITMIVKNAMTKKVFTLPPDASYSDIVKLLLKHRISGVPIVNGKGKVVGIVSEKDLFHKLFPSQKTFYQDPEYYMNFDRIEKEAVKVRKFKAKHLMSKNVVSVSSDDHILKACSLFITKGIRRLPVIDDGKLVGIVTTNNIYSRFLGHLI